MCLSIVTASRNAVRLLQCAAPNMSPHIKTVLCLAVIAVVPACVIGEQGVVESLPEPPLVDGEKRVVDEAVGISVVVPEAWRIEKDPVLFDHSHGFFIQPPDSTHAGALARVALAYAAADEDLEQLATAKLEEYKDAGAERIDLTLPGGRPAIAITGLPGVDPYTVVYTSDGDRVYEIGMWSQQLERGIDERGAQLLQQLRFRAPTQDVTSLGLTHHHESLHGEPPPELAESSRAAVERRRVLARVAAEADPAFAAALRSEVFDRPAAQSPAGTAAAQCGFTAPTSLYWQLQWDGTNTFYSGTYYNLRNQPGWSAMSGNYGSWWGTNFHVGLCYTGRLNQYYANDWPMQYWANAYAAFSGYVEWAGWGTDGFATLGRYVVVRNGNYRSLTAHLSAIRQGVTWGTWIDAYSDLVGWAGSTGGPWDPHVHGRVSWGESLIGGQPYGGESVRPARLRCFDCTDADVDAPGAGGYYTQYSHGRWMRY